MFSYSLTVLRKNSSSTTTKKAGQKTNFYGVEILHSMNLHYKIREKNPKRVSQNFVRISGD